MRRYLCFTETAMVAVKSKIQLDPDNESQMAWLERRCNGSVLVIVEVGR